MSAIVGLFFSAAISALPPASVPGVANAAVTQANIHSTICKSGWTATIRPPASYTNALKRKQLADPRFGDMDKNPRDYEEDHYVPLEIGGAPRDPKNLWPMPYAGQWGARVKDRIETRLRTEVCAGRMSLSEAQREIKTDWRKPYAHFFGQPK